jgi:hypothetical protein
MAGYFIYSIDNGVFTQLTTSPTTEQGLALADSILEEGIEYYLNDSNDKEAARWPKDREALADVIVKRLALAEWYSDLSPNGAEVWDRIIGALDDEPGELIGIGFRCYDYDSIYWDCAEIAAEHGASMMAEPTFGGSGFRYFGKPPRKHWSRPTYSPMYSLFVPEQTRTLLSQLEAVEPFFASLPDEEGSPREQFFEGLLPPVRHAAANGRVLWVQTDT